MIVWDSSKIENMYMYSPLLIRYDWQVKTKFRFWIVQLKNGLYQMCSVTAVKQFVENRGMWFVTVVQVYYFMLSDTLPLFILFIAIRIILTIVIDSSDHSTADWKA
jgi:hypothetical protein